MKRAQLIHPNWPSYCHVSFLTFPLVRPSSCKAHHSLTYMSASALRSCAPSKSIFPEPDLKYAFLPLISNVATYPCHPYNSNFLKNGAEVTISGLIGSSTCPWVIYEVRFCSKIDSRSQFNFLLKHSGSLNTCYFLGPTLIMAIYNTEPLTLRFSTGKK